MKTELSVNLRKVENGFVVSIAYYEKNEDQDRRRYVSKDYIFSTGLDEVLEFIRTIKFEEFN